MSTTLSSLWLAALLPLPGLAAEVAVHKCIAGDGRVSFQQQPCPTTARTQVVVVEGELDGARRAEGAQRAAAIDGRRAAAARQAAELAERQALAAAAAPAPVAAPAPRVICPLTYEDPGNRQFHRVEQRQDQLGYREVLVEDSAAFNAWRRSLPGKAYLKNTGRLPKECW